MEIHSINTVLITKAFKADTMLVHQKTFMFNYKMW